MWTCPLCNQQFIKGNQLHSCRNKELADFFKEKSGYTRELFHAFVKKYGEIGNITVHPTKSMIAFVAKKRMAYLTRVGKDFIDVTFPFDQPYEDNLCFHKIAQVPGQQQFNHHFRMCSEDDINEEVMHFMKRAYDENNSG